MDTVWVQVHEKNVAGYALARKLGFHPADDRGKCKHDGVGLLSLTNQRSADMMIPGSKDHAFHACMKKHDLLTRKTLKSSHFS